MQPLLRRPSLRRRGRRLRDERGQVSAVAVVLGLLLVVSFIATYTLGPLPDQEAQNEFEHELLVENQLARLQAVLISQISSPLPQAMLISPLTLGSTPVPPFGGPAAGNLIYQANATGPVLENELGSSIYHAPNWGLGTLCSSHTGSCSNSVSNKCAPPLTDNYTASNVTFTYTISGTGQCVNLNITGSNDFLHVSVPNGNLKSFHITVYGQQDDVNLSYAGSNFNTTLWVYGQSDNVNFTATGSHLAVNVWFVGETNASSLCPSGNLSVTDSAVAYSTGTGNLLNLSWYNSQNYVTPYAQTSMAPGGHLDYIGWQNLTSTSVSCAWYRTTLTADPAFAYGGLTAQLMNRYDAQATIGFEGGAILLGSSNGQSVMVDPPPISFIPTNLGPTMRFVLFSFTGRPAYVQGYSTVGIGTSVLSFKEYNLTIGTGHNQAIGDPVLNITTQFPLAWINFFLGEPQDFFNGPVKCFASTPAVQARCDTPPPGDTVRLSVQLALTSYIVDYVTVQVNIL